MQPEMEKPPKPGKQLMIEGCALVILGLVILSGLSVFVIKILNSWLYG